MPPPVVVPAVFGGPPPDDPLPTPLPPVPGIAAFAELTVHSAIAETARVTQILFIIISLS
jgi:hypothetical protein